MTRELTGIFFTTLLLVCVSPAFADTVVLSDGNRISNVRVIYQAGRVNLIRADGGIQSYEQDGVRAVIPEPVEWRLGMSEAEFASRMQGRIDEVIKRIQVEEQRRRKFKIGAVTRAAIAPGWYKMQRGDFGYGVAVLTATLASAVYYVSSAKTFAQAQKNYDDPVAPFANFVLFSSTSGPVDAYIPLNYLQLQERRSRLRAAATRFDIAAGILLAVWLANLVEALIYSDFVDLPETTTGATADPAETPGHKSSLLFSETGDAYYSFAYTESF